MASRTIRVQQPGRILSGGVSPTAGPSGGFTQGAGSLNATQDQFWFQPDGWTAGYVILHYIVAAQVQQNVNMTYNSGSSRWEYTVGNLSSGQTISYSFTYQKDGLQYDTGWSTWTHT